MQAHRSNVNYPCENPPTGLIGGSVGDPECVPTADHPAPHHRGIRTCPAAAPSEGASCARGIRTCPAAAPSEGASCADMSGFGLCSYDSGSCVCDCEGGLCRAGAEPTWRCGLPPTPGFAEWVDRSQPDLRVGADGQTNQSLFQRTASLVHDLHVPGKLCNKQGASMKVFTPAGSNDELLGGIAGFLLPVLGPYDECELLEEQQIVQFFSQAILGRAQLGIKPDQLAGLLDLAAATGLTSASELMERQSQIRGMFVEQPTPQAVARLVFSPFNSFQEALLDLPPTRDGVDIVDVHRDTIFAWEIADPISGVSYYEALSPLLTAMDENELRNEDGSLVDGYLFGDLISILHNHWSSPHGQGGEGSSEMQRACLADNGELPDSVCVLDANVAHNSYQSNGVSYEELAAEALVDARILERVKDVLVALDGIEIEPGVDGISVLVAATRTLIDPAASCVGGDCEQAPLAARNGRIETATNTGRPVAGLSPAYLLFDSLAAVDASFERDGMQERLAPWRQARSAMVDQLLDAERTGDGQWQMKNPHIRVVLLEGVALLRERLALYRGQQADCESGGGTDCRQLRDWSEGLSDRMATSLGQPISAAALRLMDQFWGAPEDPGGELLKLVHWLAQEPSAERAFDTSLLAIVDTLQVLDDDTNIVPLMHFLATAIAPNAQQALEDPSLALDVREGALEKTLELLRQIQRVSPGTADDPSTLAKLVRAMAAEHGADGESPLEILLDSIAEVNRVAPGNDEGRSLTAEDLRAVLHQSERFLADERHGLERLYDVLQSRQLP